MKEYELKDLFVSSLESGHIFDNKNRNLAFTNPDNEIRVKSEGYFGHFDLVIAILHRVNKGGSYLSSDETEAYDNVLMRTGQLAEIARAEKCRIDCISFYPVELKSGCDILDVRLPNQIMNGILTFGKSIVVLDKKHVNRASLKFLRLLPATIIGYTGTKDFFRILSVFDRNINTGVFNLSKRRFAKTLGDNGIVEDIERIYGRLRTLERISQKLMFNELYNSDPGFLEEEIEFLRQFSSIKTAMTYRKQILSYIKESENDKISNYL
ncbi:MAG: hypothetical protein M3297_13755 [Thermoproteota archaeon]|jgi:hypothetical protein|nr:hypothetical protein [Thermoproteota archaeon]